MLTQALMIGMTPEQFWDESPSLFFNYLHAYERRKKNEYEAEIEKMNLNAWLEGMYMCSALRANPVMGKGKPYPEKPIELKKSDTHPETESAEKKAEERKKVAMAQMIQFEQYAKLYNQTYFNKEEGE